MGQTDNQVGLGAIWMTGAIVSFTAMAVAGRELSTSHDTFEMMLFRSLLGIVIVTAVLTATGNLGQISTNRLGLHTLRNITHFTGQNLWFYAIGITPLSVVFALEFTQPLWVIVLAPLLIGERMTRIRAFSATLGFVGILIVSRPTADTLSLGIFAAAAAAFFFALTTMATKRLTRDVPIGGIMFWMTVIQAVLGLVFAGYDMDITLPTLTTLPWLTVIALGGLVAHFCITNALAIAPATVVIPIDFARLPAVAIVGMLLYNEAIDVWVIVGAVVIFGANYLNILSETRKNRVA
ncbi:MAG: DMT family transporter [Paracoccaceae bacterium]